MSVKKRINQKTHKDKSIRKSRRIRRRLRRLRRKSRKLMGGVKEDCITLNDYKQKLAEYEKKLDDEYEKIMATQVGKASGISARDLYDDTNRERTYIDFYKKKIKKLNELDHCKDESIFPSEEKYRTENCKSCNSK